MIDRFVAQPHCIDVAAVAAKVDGPGAGAGAKHRARVDVLTTAILVADIEVAQVKRLVDRANADRALANMAAHANRIGVAAVDAGVRNGSPAALIPMSILRRGGG